MQPVESCISRETTGQPSAPVVACSFEARERLIDLAKAGHNGGDEYLG